MSGFIPGTTENQELKANNRHYINSYQLLHRIFSQFFKAHYKSRFHLPKYNIFDSFTQCNVMPKPPLPEVFSFVPRPNGNR